MTSTQPTEHTHSLHTPYSRLTPDVVLDALAAVGFDGDGRLMQLNSFENRVFQVMMEDGSAVVTKFYRPDRWSDEQILEEHAFTLEAAACDVPVVAPMALRDAGHGRLAALLSAPSADLPTLARVAVGDLTWRLAVWPRRAGRSPELEDAAVMHRLGQALARLHGCGSAGSFQRRERRAPLQDARDALSVIERSSHLPPDQIHGWQRVSEQVLQAIALRCNTHTPAQLRIHGDCHPGNLLWRDDRPNLVDFDDCATGAAVQDLWMLLSGEPEAARQQLGWLLDGYTEFRAFDEREIGLIPAMRLSRMLRHNAWVASRWSDPAFPAAWPDFGRSGYWAQQALQLQELAAEALS